MTNDKGATFIRGSVPMLRHVNLITQWGWIRDHIHHPESVRTPRKRLPLPPSSHTHATPMSLVPPAWSSVCLAYLCSPRVSPLLLFPLLSLLTSPFFSLLPSSFPPCLLPAPLSLPVPPLPPVGCSGAPYAQGGQTHCRISLHGTLRPQRRSGIRQSLQRRLQVSPLVCRLRALPHPWILHGRTAKGLPALQPDGPLLLG